MDSTLGQALEEVFFTLEFGHFHKGIAYLISRMGVAAGGAGQVVFPGKSTGLLGEAEQWTAGIEYLYHINLSRYFIEGDRSQG